MLKTPLGLLSRGFSCGLPQKTKYLLTVAAMPLEYNGSLTTRHFDEGLDKEQFWLYGMVGSDNPLVIIIRWKASTAENMPLLCRLNSHDVFGSPSGRGFTYAVSSIYFIIIKVAYVLHVSSAICQSVKVSQISHNRQKNLIFYITLHKCI